MTDYLKPGEESHIGPFEPVNPCRMFETRACVDLSLDDDMRYRATPCDAGMCTRFPNADKGEPLVKGELTIKQRIDP